MEANMVILSLGDYENLREFKKTIEDGGAVVKWMERHGDYNYTHCCYTKDEAIKELGGMIKSLENSNFLFKEKIRSLENRTNNNKTMKETKGITIDDLKNMSLWEFLRWRKIMLLIHKQ